MRPPLSHTPRPAPRASSDRERTVFASGRRLSGASLLAAACLLGLLGAMAATASSSSANDTAQLRSLDEQVQEVKSDVLEIAAELSNLEEKLLFPSDTQLAVFVSFEGAGRVELDSTEIRIDGERIAAHVYSFKEVEALRRGGVQRIHTGNVTNGHHRLEVVVTGRTGSGGEIERTKGFEFEKGVGPKLLEISLATDRSGDEMIMLGQR